MKDIEVNKNSNEIIRDYVFSLFTDNINIEYDLKKYLENTDKEKIIPLFANMSMINDDVETVAFCLNKEENNKSIMIEYILENKKIIVESILGNFSMTAFNSLYNLVNLIDKNGYYKFNNKILMPFNIEILRLLSNVKFAFINTTDDITEVHIPKDLLKIIKKAMKDESIISKMYETSELLRRIQGLISIYGVFKLSDICSLDPYFKEYSYYQIESICWRLKGLDPLYEITLYEDELILYSTEFDNEEDVVKILTNPLNYKKYDDKTLEKLYDEEFIYTLAPYQEMKKLLKKFNLNDEDINTIKELLFDDYIIVSQLDINKAKNYFLTSLRNFTNDEEYGNLLLGYASKIANKFPKWELKGDIEKNQTLRVKKVGRNDKCPCGSGRKFKQCCGK